MMIRCFTDLSVQGFQGHSKCLSTLTCLVYMYNYLHHLSPWVMYDFSPLGRKVKACCSKLPKLNKKAHKGNKIYSFITLIG